VYGSVVEDWVKESIRPSPRPEVFRQLGRAPALEERSRCLEIQQLPASFVEASWLVVTP
jgi:hypothetical protein